jgi:hypothetical protein
MKPTPRRRANLCGRKPRVGSTRIRLQPVSQPATRSEPDEPPYLQAAGNYRLREDGLYYVRTNRDGGRAYVQLTNFPAVITADIERDDGATRSRAFKIFAKVQGQAKEIVIGTKGIPLDGLAPRVPRLERHRLPEPQRPHENRHAGTEPRENFQYVYQHTGWTKWKDEWIYLHAGGAIGQNGPVDGLLIELDPQLSRFRLPDPPEGGSW